MSCLCTSSIVYASPVFSSAVRAFLIPFTNTSELRSSTFRPIFKIFYWLLVADFLILGWIGQKPVKDIYVLVGQVATVFYFVFFIILIPLIGFLETRLAHFKK